MNVPAGSANRAAFVARHSPRSPKSAMSTNVMVPPKVHERKHEVEGSTRGRTGRFRDGKSAFLPALQLPVSPPASPAVVPGFPDNPPLPSDAPKEARPRFCRTTAERQIPEELKGQPACGNLWWNAKTNCKKN